MRTTNTAAAAPKASSEKVAGVEDGDDDDREQIVCNGQCCDEDLEADWDARAEQREDVQGEGDVRRHRHAPAVAPLSAACDSHEDHRGQHCAADRAVVGGLLLNRAGTRKS